MSADPSQTPPTPAGPARRIYLGLGSNLGDRRAHLDAALRGLRSRGVRPVASSPVYVSAPVGGPPQGDFLNAVVEAWTDLPPPRLLEAALAVERERGRRRGADRDGPRTLDVDLLLYGDQVLESERLRVPHPRMHRRRFVLVPLSDLCPDRMHPLQHRTIRHMLRDCPDRSAVARHGPPLALPD